MKTFASRYNGFCQKCHNTVAAGEMINWAPGYTEHVTCPVVTTPVINPTVPFGYADQSGINVSEIELGRWGSRFAVPFDGEGAFDGYWFCKIEQSKFGNNRYIKWTYGETDRLVAKQMGNWGSAAFQNKYADRFESLLAELATDPDKFKALYGQRVGKCGHCGKRLTDAESRRIGIGPVCRDQLKWYRP